MKCWAGFLILLLFSNFAFATTEESCYMEEQNLQKAMHTVVEGCDNIGVFSIGGLYNGRWEKLTYLYPKPWPGTFLTLKVNEKYYSTSKYPKNAQPMDEYVVQKPLNLNGVIRTGWRLPEGLVVEQILETVDNGTSIIVKLKNDNANPIPVGVRIHIDTMLGYNDGAPIYIPGDGLITVERDYSGNKLNFRYWKAYNQQDNPTIVATGTVDPDLGLSYPSRIVVADWKRSKDTAWDYTVNTSRSILGDSAVILYYYNITLQPGENYTVKTNYGNEAPVLPPEKGAFGLAEVLTDNVYGYYCGEQTAKLTVDVIATRGGNSGSVNLTVSGPEGILYSSVQATGQLEPDRIRTLEFNAVIPNKTASYDVSAVLSASNGTILDSISKKSMLRVELKRCLPPVPRTKLYLTATAVLLLLLLAAILLLPKLKGSVEFSKTVDEGGKVSVTLRNGTRRQITEITVEDKIPTQAEVHTITLGVIRRENYLAWTLKQLNPSEDATMEYMIKGAHVLPPARARWNNGEATSK